MQWWGLLYIQASNSDIPLDSIRPSEKTTNTVYMRQLDSLQYPKKIENTKTQENDR